MRKTLLFLVFLAATFLLHAQDFSNKGKDFWVGYGYHTIMIGNNAQDMVLYFATDQVTTVTVTIPGTGYSQTYSNIPANTVFSSNPIPKTGAQDARLYSETATPQNKGIHIVSDKAIVAYAHIYNSSVSGATILFPTNTLGKEYYSINYKNVSNTSNANCWFYVIACDTGTTTVEIIPSANTLTHAAGVPFTVTLTQGQIYNFMGQLTNNSNPFTGVDLTGSRIRSIAAAGNSCKRIAVFSGSGRISITCNNTSSSSDNYMAQSFPKSAWGKKFLTVNTGGLVNNIYRICVSDPTAAVTVNGAPVTVPLVNGFYYELPATSVPQKIEASLPITVAQYVTSQGACGNGSPGDPEVIYLSPVEQNISKVIWNATPNFLITSHYYSVVIPNSGTAISSFKLDGVAVNPALFTVHPQDPAYSFLIQSVGSQQRRIESDSGFNAIAYGFGNAESYGYNAGTNVRDLYQRVGVTSQYGVEPLPSVCTGSPFKFKISLPYLPDSIKWNLSGLPGSPPDEVRTYSSPGVPSDADSSTVVSGKTIYWFSIPSFYNFTTTGIFPVSITVYAATSEGCGNEQLIDFDLEITNPPVAAINWVHNGCINQVVQFNDQSTTVKPTYQWWWSFGDPASGTSNTSTLKNPTHNFSAPGTYNVRFATITTPGCLSDTITRQIVINPLPTGNISGPSTICQGAGPAAIVFAGTVGTAPFTFTYNINNGPAQTITTTSGSTVSLPISTTALGTFAYHLVSVRDAAGAAGCFQNQPDTVILTVTPVPTASVAGTAMVCRNAPPPAVTFTGTNTLPPYTFSYNINGGATQTITSTGNSISLPAATATAGTFVYNLTAITDANAIPCGQPQAGVVTITVNPLPTATISGSTEVCVGASGPAITFTGANGTAPYTFSYSLNGGAAQTLTSAGSVGTISVSTTTAGTYTYALLSVRDAVSVLCSQAQTGSATVVINPLPTASFNATLPACVNRTLNFTDNSTANAGALSGWTWNFGDPSSGSANTSSLQNPTHNFAVAGTYTVMLTVTNDKGCTSAPFSRIITVGTRPTAGFTLPEVCLLDPFAQFTDSSKSVAPATIASWRWSFGEPASGGNNSSTVQNAQHTYSAVGNYNVQLIVATNTGCTDTLTQQLTVNGGNPQAAFLQLNATSSCSSDTVTIQNKSTIASGNITKVEIYWDNAAQPSIFETDDVPVFDERYKHKYPLSNTTRNYTIRFRAFSGGVCVNDRLQTVTVLATPDVAFSTIPVQCYRTQPVPLTYGFQNGSVVGIETYSGPGVVFAGGSWKFIPSVAGIGTHSIQYKFTATAGGCADSVSANITVLDTATTRFTVVQPICQGNTVTFNQVSSSPPAVTLVSGTWDFGDGTAPQTFAIGAAVTHVYGAAGTYNVSMYTTSTAGCRSGAEVNIITVGPQPRANFTMPASLCLPAASASFTDLSSIADGTEASFTYAWNFGDPGSGAGNISNAKNPTHVYSAVGPYSVKLQVTSGAGCFHDTTIVLSTIHPQPKADFGFSAPAICLADSVSFIDRSNGGDGSIAQWQWTFGDGNGSANQNPSHVYATASTFNVKLFITNSFGCNSDTVTRPFTVYPYPLVSAGGIKYVLEGGSVPLTTNFTGQQLSWLWTPATYLNSNTAPVPVSTPLQDITYNVTVTNPGGCSATDVVFVSVLKGPNIPNTFSPNNDGINDKWLIDYLDTYPNCRVKIFTRQGQLVFESRGYKTPWDGTMNGKTLPIDTYYYIIEPENGRKPLTGYITIIK